MADASVVFHPRILEIKLPDIMDKLGKQFQRLRIAGWTMYYFGRGEQPLGLGAVNRGDAFADVILIRHADDASAFRAPQFTGVASDLFKPTIVTWQRHGDPVPVVRAIRLAPAWGSPKNPTSWLAPKPGCRVPDSWPEPIALPPIKQRGSA